jgi:hypothetical protein
LLLTAGVGRGVLLTEEATVRTTDLIDELRRLPLADRLTVLEMTLHEMREEFGTSSAVLTAREAIRYDDQKLLEAAISALPLYESDDKFTAFTALDGELFHDSTTMKRGEI